MRISDNRINQPSFNQNLQTRTNKVSGNRRHTNAFKVDISTRALLSPEYNRKDNNFPIHNPDALTYTKQSKIIYKPY